MNNFHGDDLSTQLNKYGRDQGSTPPDTTLGAGNGFVVEPLNNSVWVYSSGGQLQATADLYGFWANVLPSGHTLTDSQAVFDSVSPDHRFYMTTLGWNPNTSDSEVLFAASQTSNPTGTWTVYNLGTTSGVMQDQPFLGLSNDKLTIGVNDFDTSGTLIGSATSVLNKADADAGVAIHQQTFGPEPYWRPSPARSTSSTTTQYVVSIGGTNSTTLDVMMIAGVPSATTSASRAVKSLGISETFAPPDADQPGRASSINTDDVRALEAVWQGSILWVGSNDGCTPAGDSSERSCMRLIQLAAPVSGTPSVTQDFDMSTTGGHLYYPGVALDQSQSLYVAHTLSSSSVDPSGQVLSFTAGSPSAHSSVSLQGGVQYAGFDPSPYRWGDYSGAAIDPTNPSDVWVATEFGGGDSAAGSGTNWATQISRVNVPAPLPPRAYHPLTPARITDTRPDSGFPNAGKPLGPNTSLNVQVTGAGGVPAAGVTAVALNVTATNPTQQSFLTIWPTGASRPMASNLNFSPGETVPNLVEVGLGTGGQVSIFNPFGSVDVVVDVEGYVGPAATAGTGLYNPLTPARITDTRPNSGFPNAGKPLGPNTALTVQVTGAGGVPATGVAAVVLNVTATNPTQPSFLSVWPTATTRPTASNLNFSVGQTVPNRVMVRLGSGGQVSIFNPAGSVDVVVDVGGYFTDASNPAATGAQFTPTTPARITDTRPGSGFPNAGKTLGPNTTLTVQVTGAGGVPASGITAAVMNVTVTDTTQSSVLTVWPTATTPPEASDLNWVAGETVPNLVVVKLGLDGAVQVFNAAGSTDVVVDVSGWYS